ncbi:GH26 domain-containing protein [Tumidithrix helvetica PCC 7403]|uniref:hypothetical protein n=1 Tax=Tumidithrix helvetica TaxID=3457545 RepID=UPI003CBB4A10
MKSKNKHPTRKFRVKQRTLLWVGMFVLGLLFVLAIASGHDLMAVANERDPLSPKPPDRLLLQTAPIAKPPVLLGLYTDGYAGSQSTIDRELHQVDEWSGKKHAIVGIFMDIQGDNPAYNIGHRLELLRENGYTAFINLKSTRLAAEIARGDLDSDLRRVASAVADWTNKGDGRMMFVAPLQEMNIEGESYSLDPENFKLSYKRIQQIFAESGVSSQAVRWVFSPNGFSRGRNHDFENYYPSDARVDIVGFSSYNWGYCHSSLNQRRLWDRPEEGYGVYIDRMQKMAPDKPIFITQMASSSYSTPNYPNDLAKEKWLYESYGYLAKAPAVQAILYFNIQKECDWALNPQSQNAAESYKAIVANPAFGYADPREIAQVVDSFSQVTLPKPSPMGKVPK